MKRYGRNQKRKHLEQIKVLSTMLTETGKTNGTLLSKIDTLDSVIKEVAEVLGDHFAALPPSTVELKALPSEMQEYRYYKRMANSPFGFQSLNRGRPELLVSQVMSVAMIYDEPLQIDKLRDQIVMRFSYRGERVAFSISQEHIDHCPERAARVASSEMADLIINRMKKQGVTK